MLVEDAGGGGAGEEAGVAKPGSGALVEDAGGGGAGRRPALGGKGVPTRVIRDAPQWRRWLGALGEGGAGCSRDWILLEFSTPSFFLFVLPLSHFFFISWQTNAPT